MSSLCLYIYSISIPLFIFVGGHTVPVKKKNNTKQTKNKDARKKKNKKPHKKKDPSHSHTHTYGLFCINVCTHHSSSEPNDPIITISFPPLPCLRCQTPRSGANKPQRFVFLSRPAPTVCPFVLSSCCVCCDTSVTPNTRSHSASLLHSTPPLATPRAPPRERGVVAALK